MPVHLRVQKRQIELEVQFRKSNLQFQPTESVKRFASEFLKSATRIAREKKKKGGSFCSLGPALTLCQDNLDFPSRTAGWPRAYRTRSRQASGPGQTSKDPGS